MSTFLLAFKTSWVTGRVSQKRWFWTIIEYKEGGA